MVIGARGAGGVTATLVCLGLGYCAPKVMSPLLLSFYEGCIRARNDKLKTVLGVKLRYPNYREGLRAHYDAGDHLTVGGPG